MGKRTDLTETRKYDARWPGPDEDGVQRLRCRARRKSDGGQCKRWAMLGQTVCKTHGGGNKRAREAGARRWREHTTITAVTQFLESPAVEAVDPITDPLGQFRLLMTEALSWKTEMAARVNRLGGVLTTESVDGVLRVHPDVELYERAQERAQKFLEFALKHDLLEREIQLREREAEMVAVALTKTLTQLDLRPELVERAKGLLANELAAYTTAEAIEK